MMVKRKSKLPKDASQDSNVSNVPSVVSEPAPGGFVKSQEGPIAPEDMALLKSEALLNMMEDLENERKKATENEQKYKSLYEGSDDGFVLVDMQGRIKEFNEGYLRIIGYSAKEALKLTYNDLTPRKWHALEADIVKREVIKKGRSGLYEKEYIRKDGTVVPVNLKTYLVKDQSKKPIGMWAFVRDISERKKSEQRLSENEKKYHFLAENTVDIIYSYDLKGKITYMSPNVRNYGYRPEDCIGKSILDFVHPKDRMHALKSFLKTMRTRESFPTTLRLRRKNGEIIYAEEWSKPIIKDGKVTGSIGTIRDISERLESEKRLTESENRFKLIFDNAPDAIYLVDLNGKYIDGNRQSEIITGYKKESAIGKNFLGIGMLPKKDLLRGAKLFAMNRAGKATGPDVFNIIRKDKTVVPLEIRTYPIEIAGKKLVMGIARDISQRKKMDQAAQDNLSLLSSTMQSTADGILVIDKKGKVEFYNNRFLELWDIPQKLADKKDDKLLLRHVLSQLSDPKQFLSKVNYLYSHPSEESEDTIYFKDGRIFDRYSIPQKVGKDIVGRVWSFRDVTEKKRAEEDLRASEEQFRTIVENANEVIMLTLPNRKVSYISDNSSEFIGWPAKDLIGTVPDIFHAEDRLRVMQALSSAVSGKSGRNLEYRVVGKDKKVHWVSHSWAPLMEKGKLRLIISTISNLDERKIAEEELRSSNEQMSHLINSVNVSIYTSKAYGDYGATSLTRNVEKITGYRPEQFLKDPSFWARNIHPDDRSYAFAQVKIILKDMSHSYEYRFRHKNGSYIWVRDDARLIKDRSGKPVEIIGYWTDITDKKKAEANIAEGYSFRESVIQSAAEGIAVCHSIKGFPYVQFTVWNNRMKDLTGYSIEDINKSGWYQSVYPDPEYRAKAKARMDRMRKGDNLKAEEWIITRRDGAKRTITISTNMLKSAEGSVHVLAVMNDITEKKRSEESLKLAYEDLKKVDELKSTAITEATHELKTPISKMNMVAAILKDELYKDKPDRTRMLNYVELLMKNSNRSLEQITSTLELSKLTATKDIIKSDTDIGVIIKDVLRDKLVTVVNKGLFLKEMICEGCTARGDKKLIAVVLSNLVDNAIKFTKRGTIEVRCVRKGKNILLSVKDTGIGIKAKDLDALFHPFTQIDKSSEGVGVGLAICKRIAELHGGSLSVSSTYGKGTRFTLVLPR